MKTVVCKLGGSLLSMPDLAERLSQFLKSLAARPLLIVGGGAAADLVREWDSRFHLGQERSHRLALEAMRLNEVFVAELLAPAEVVATRDDAESLWQRGGWPILSASAFLAAEELLQSKPLPLPHHWDVTSDSIAAWVTLCWPADELVILKSADRPEGPFDELAAQGFVDSYFARIAPELPRFSWVNLRR